MTVSSIIFCIVIIPSLCFATKRQINSVATRCHGETCDYIVEIQTNANSNGSEMVALPGELLGKMSKLQKNLGTLAKILQLEYIKTSGDMKALLQNLTAVREQMENRTDYWNATYTKNRKQMMKEVEDLRSRVSRLSGVVSGTWHIGDSTPIQPATPINNTITAASDCASLYKAGVNVSGIYTLQPDPADNRTVVDTYCDMDTNGGGWTVIQRRIDGSDDFFRNWESYKNGFGELHHDFWLGLEYAHLLTKFGNNRMRIDLWDWENETRYSEFEFVRIRNEDDKYRLLAGSYHGNAGDPFHSFDYFERMQSMRFSTFDNDNDMNSKRSCAQIFNSGWWFNNCFRVNLNGVWYPSSSYYGAVANGITWDLWQEHKSGYSLRKTEIKLRPEHF